MGNFIPPCQWGNLGLNFSCQKMPFLHLSDVGRASRAFNQKQEEYDAANKEKLLHRLMSVATFNSHNFLEIEIIVYTWVCFH